MTELAGLALGGALVTLGWWMGRQHARNLRHIAYAAGIKRGYDQAMQEMDPNPPSPDFWTAEDRCECGCWDDDGAAGCWADELGS